MKVRITLFYNQVIFASSEERQKVEEMEDKGESSKSVKPSVHTQRDKPAAAAFR